MEVLDAGDRAFCLLRRPAGPQPPLLALANVTDGAVTLPAEFLRKAWGSQDCLEDILAPGTFHETGEPLPLAPYQCAWLSVSP